MRIKKNNIKFHKNEPISVANKYPSFTEWTWRTYDGTQIVDPEIFVKDNKETQFFIGTDSQIYKDKTIYTTVIVAYKMGHGGKIILHSDKTENPSSLRHRLLMEAMRSLEAAYFVNNHIPSQSKISVHLDVNQNLKWKSGRYKEELVGLVVAQGFSVATKPNAWASSSVADSRT